MRVRNMIYKGFALIAFAGSLWGCSNANIFAPGLDNGKHPANWPERHWVEYLQELSVNQKICEQCHGGDLKGGISQVSCFTANIGVQVCHATGPAAHPLDWPRPELHGAAAKAAPDAANMKGFSTCQGCHGLDFAGGSANLGATAPVSCLSTGACHTVPAPHAIAPWLNHESTDTANAPVCAYCHRGNPATPAFSQYSTSLPPSRFGCFNGTLCHGASGHPAGWSDPAQHGATAKGAPSATQGFSFCQTCHGSDFHGSGAAVSCFSASVGATNCHATPPAVPDTPHSPAPWRTTAGSAHTHTDTNTDNAPVCGLCHLNNARLTTPVAVPPGTTPTCFNGTLCHSNPVTAPHPVPFGLYAPFANATTHGHAARKDLTYCQGCHASSQGGAGTNPRFNVALDAILTPNGCENCHINAGAHPGPAVNGDTTQGGFTYWNGHQNAGNLATACALCHGATLAGGAGPACSTCHTLGSPLTNFNCSSCHGNPPPQPFETNQGHKEHDTLAPNLTGMCSVCHLGAGSGTTLHFNGTINVVFTSAFNAKTGAATFDPATKTCANVSCHGGITTPVWDTGYIIVSTDCTSCHVRGTALATPQFNSYYSGRHGLSEHVSAGCTACHNTVTLDVNHFTHLETSAMEGPASATIGGGSTSIPAGNYNPTTHSCSPSCHGTETWQ